MKNLEFYKTILIFSFISSIFFTSVLFFYTRENVNTIVDHNVHPNKTIYYIRLSFPAKYNKNLVDTLYPCIRNNHEFFINFTYSTEVDSLLELTLDLDLKNRDFWFRKAPVVGLPRMIMGLESYLNSRCIKHEDCINKFNWTSLTSPNSDIHAPYIGLHSILPFIKTVGKFDFQRDVMKVKKEYEDNILKENNGNTSMVPIASWLANNCDIRTSNRFYYIQELMKHISVNSYGECLNNAPKPNPKEIKSDIINKHKFYLSFENSICKGYITEKPLDCLTAGTVPVVFGHPDNVNYLPKGSYVDVGDFKSAKELADHLIYLSQNEQEYKKFFDWRNDHEIIDDWKSFLSNQTSFPCDIPNHVFQSRQGKIPPKELHSIDFDDCLPIDYYKV